MEYTARHCCDACGTDIADPVYVFITGRRQTELDRAVKKIGKNVTGVQGDVSNLDDLDRLYDTSSRRKAESMYCLQMQALAKSGRWDLLLNPILIKRSASM
jgi:hypothetical protein